MNADHIPVKIHKHHIFFSPWIGSAVIRIGESTHACLIPIINRRCARPCHLNNNCFPENPKVDAILCGFRSMGFHTSHGSVGPRKKSRMIVVGQFIHRTLQLGCLETCHKVAHSSLKIIHLSLFLRDILVTVFFHSCQKPCQRFHKGIVIHDCIPLVTFF